ncbi:MAG: hypothetical protein ACI86H_000010 [bacterium]|jgi:hypothetical protein
MDAEINPYTRAMQNCLNDFSPESDLPAVVERNTQFLANMIQGRFLQHLASSIRDYYNIEDIELEKQLTLALMNILSERFFGVFREKIKANSKIVFLLAKRITRTEFAPKRDYDTIRKLYLGICRRYFDYKNIEMMITWIQQKPEIQKVIFSSHLQKLISNPRDLKILQNILLEDNEGVVPLIFSRYLSKNKHDRLINLVETGEWKIEAEFVLQNRKKLEATKSSE